MSETAEPDPEFQAATASDPVVGTSKPRLLGILGPGLITGASDDDPSGIATYSQAGAQTGFALLWLMPFTYPLMAVTQEISARLGRTTGHGLAGNIRRHYPAWVAHSCIGLLLIANIGLGAQGRRYRQRAHADPRRAWQGWPVSQCHAAGRSAHPAARVVEGRAPTGRDASRRLTATPVTLGTPNSLNPHKRWTTHPRVRSSRTFGRQAASETLHESRPASPERARPETCRSFGLQGLAGFDPCQSQPEPHDGPDRRRAVIMSAATARPQLAF
jgi:hypothetical protein